MKLSFFFRIKSEGKYRIIIYLRRWEVTSTNITFEKQGKLLGPLEQIRMREDETDRLLDFTEIGK